MLAIGCGDVDEHVGGRQVAVCRVGRRRAFPTPMLFVSALQIAVK